MACTRGRYRSNTGWRHDLAELAVMLVSLPLPSRHLSFVWVLGAPWRKASCCFQSRFTPLPSICLLTETLAVPPPTLTDSLVFMGAWQSQVLGKRFRRLLLRTHHQSKDCLYLKETHGALDFKHFTAFRWTGPSSQTDCSRTSMYNNRQL